MFGWIKQFERRSRAFSISAALGTVIAVGLVDLATRWEFSFSVFYLLAVGLATWRLGKRFGIFISIFSVAVSLIGDFATAPRYASPFQPYWNASIVLAFYSIVVWLLVSLRSLQQELEARVRQRTAALTNEMTERQRLETELLEISEREQRRIGHDLHDSLCQHLTGAALAGQVLEGKLAAQHRPEAADANKVIELIEQGIALSRNLAKGLHPIEFEAEGLMHALDELAATSSDLFKVACRFECDSPVLIKEALVSGHLYRVAQEAVSNAVKHGKAKNIVISLATLEDGLELEIKDDGLGLPDPLPKSAGMGLRIMAHRAGMIGAAFQARRGRSGGTIVSVLLQPNEKAEVIAS
jgi:signal transduction histidine kinase